MTTPLATIADALIEFILSLLSDPAAAAEFEEDPQGTLARNGLSDACVEDVRAVAPVIVDRPDVTPKPPMPPAPPRPPSVENEIYTITNSFAIDNRATIVDQSVNQNIWAHGDVNQIFDQEAVVNSGDNGAAAGDDAEVDNSQTDATIGDVSIGNEDTTTTITDSFDDESTNTDVEVDVEVDDSFNDGVTDAAAAAPADEAAPVEDAVAPVEEVAPAAEVEAPSEDSYDYAADSVALVVEEPPLDMESEDQY